VSTFSKSQIEIGCVAALSGLSYRLGPNDPAQPFLAEALRRLHVLDSAMREVALSLSPDNENVRRGDLIASIRDLRLRTAGEGK
jgi:hypothetical protein